MDPTTIVPGIFPGMSTGGGASTIPTPQQIQTAYANASAYTAQGLNPSTPVHSWTQGVQQMVNALAGAYTRNKANQLSQQYWNSRSNAYDTSNLPAQRQLPPQQPLVPPVPPQVQMPPPVPAPPANNAPASTYGAGVPYLFGPGGGQ